MLPLRPSGDTIGDDPQRAELEARYGNRGTFAGYKHGHELANYFASTDVMVFPSRTDSLGTVMIESMF